MYFSKDADPVPTFKSPWIHRGWTPAGGSLDSCRISPEWGTWWSRQSLKAQFVVWGFRGLQRGHGSWKSEAQ